MEPLSDEDMAFVEAQLALQEKELLNLKGKHIKLVLTRLEKQGTVHPMVRKIILDEFNDLMRDVLRSLGFEVAD